MDGDNDQDVLITGRNSSGAQISKLYTNDGGGTFTEMTGTPFEEVAFSSIAFADVDGDNDQDVLITGQNSSFAEISKLYTNDGGGHFHRNDRNPFRGR
ncbi:MAG: VCBS repeat-containing protein [Bacteroidota bacterium]